MVKFTRPLSAIIPHPFNDQISENSSETEYEEFEIEQLK